MKKKELKFILQEGEGLKIEFKENLSGIDKEITSFANSEGPSEYSIRLCPNYCPGF